MGGSRVREGWKGLLPKGWVTPPEARFRMESPGIERAIGDAIYQMGQPMTSEAESLLLLCIGTDRSIGDALGPLVGSLLEEEGNWPFTVLGTLDNPVHASNLVDTLTWIDGEFERPLVIAIDACLGRLESVGCITVGKGPLKPGAGVNKSLPPVGQLYVTGVVNVGGFMEYFVLQNTRLNLVMRMAKLIANGAAQGATRLANRVGRWPAASRPPS